ncbi:MAG: translation initiation factor IF-3 [bacterium]
MRSASLSVRVNEAIRVKEVRVIDAYGAQVGVLPTNEARALAVEQGYDLVEVAPEAKPPVCKIMDYGKYKYQQRKRAHEAKRNQKVIQVKEIKLKPSTDEHDIQFKVRNAQKFLEAGDKVKFTVNFRGREFSHIDLGRNVLERIAKDLEVHSSIDLPSKMEGRNLVIIFAPKK